MKKVVCLFLCMMMIFAIVACNKTEEVKPPVEENPVVESAEPADTEATPEPEQADTPEESAEPKQEPVEEPAIVPEGIEDAVEATNPQEPAEFGKWVKASIMNPVSEKSETVYWRITNVTDDCDEQIKQYNENSNFWTIDPLEDEDMKYYVADYEVYFPKEFSEREYGISVFTLDVSIRNMDGGSGFEHDGANVYGLSSGLQFDIERYNKVVRSGDVYQGKLLYRMYSDIEDYLFSVFYQIEGSDDYATCFCRNKAIASEENAAAPEPAENVEENVSPEAETPAEDAAANETASATENN